MPNTLAHLGVQGLATRALLPRSDLKWIALGCALPDLPWIARRLVRPFVGDATLLDQRLVRLVQGSLLFCLVLSGAFSTLAREPGKVFRILALNSLLHLLLDACRTKWGNGVHLFAPVSWKLTNFGLFWPESPVTVVLTVGGLAALRLVEKPGDRRSPVAPAAAQPAGRCSSGPGLATGPRRPDLGAGVGGQ